jgi:hypothetical protein
MIYLAGVVDGGGSCGLHSIPVVGNHSSVTETWCFVTMKNCKTKMW